MDEITVWDGKGSVQALADAVHVHDKWDNCIKNRDGARCKTGKANRAPSLTQPQKLALTGVLEEVRKERFEQVEKGYTPEHDDALEFHDLQWYATRRLPVLGMRPTREQLLEAASVLVAAIESMDRRTQ